jgi:hypothetical protein
VKIGDDNVWPADTGRQSLRLMNTLNKPRLRQAFVVTPGQWYEISMAVARDPSFPNTDTLLAVTWQPYDATGRVLSGKATGFFADSTSYTTRTTTAYAWGPSGSTAGATSAVLTIDYTPYINTATGPSHDMLIDSVSIVPTDPPPGF